MFLPNSYYHSTARFFVAVTFAVSFSLLLRGDVHAEEPKPPTEEEIRQAEVYKALGDMIKRRDTLLKKFAVVMHGEVVMTGTTKSPVITFPYLQCRVVDQSRAFDLRASFSIDDYNAESGFEVVKIGTQYKSRHYMFRQRYTAKPDDIKLKSWLEQNQAAGLDPFDDYLTGIGSMRDANNVPLIENVVLKKYELLRTERGVGGRLISHWRFNANKYMDLSIRMEFDSTMEMMPISVSRVNSLNKKYFEEMRYEWERHGSTLVPKRISFANSDASDNNVVEEYSFRCYWLIGDEVPDAIFTSEDHLAALLDHFKITHTQMVLGEPFNEPHVLPADLYGDVPTQK